MRVIKITVGENDSTLEKNYLIVKGLIENKVEVKVFHFAYDLQHYYSFCKSYINELEYEVIGSLFKGRMKIQKLLNNLKLSFILFIKLRNLIANKNFDAIIISRECPSEILIVLKLISKLYHIPLITNIMEYSPVFFINIKSMLKKLIRQIQWNLLIKISDAYLVISKYLQRKLSIYNKPIFYLPIIFDPSHITYKKSPNFINSQIVRNLIAKKKPILVYSSSSSYTDLLSFCLQAISIIKSQNFILAITGNYKENEKSYWIQYIKSLGLEEKVYFTGYLDKYDLINLMQNSTAMLIPLLNNIRHIARFPQKILQYIYLEKPIISTAIGEIKEHFIDNETAFLDYTITPQGYAKKISYVLKNPDRVKEVARNAKYYVETKFNYLTWTFKLKNFIETLNKIKRNYF